MLKRLLVANRGEIVCRIARTARRLGLTTIAVYSDADRGARHVRVADEAYHLGGSPAAESYLNVPRLIALAQRVGADAIHPGYGFLSENAGFAQACVDAGLIFIGPPAAAIVAMGSKSASKAAMSAVGVPVAPGYHGTDQSLDTLSAEAEKTGFPLIIKASAGGGGKGMQVVHSSAGVASAIASAQRLARAAFGDERLLFERYFPRARHVEVQVFADLQGQTTALFDRDCSVQRRHQKIIEEAPAPGLRSEVRTAMAAAAVTAARAVGYVGAGTVEFLLDEEQRFYFMEMNTRLQVEHPVTELVTGIDLVEWQIRVARGEPLPQAAGTVQLRGCAVEARLYAEDPAQDYLPSVGRITQLRWPGEGGGLRLDVGVDGGDDVSPFYDPMLAKIVAWGETRLAAIDTLQRGLNEVRIGGVATNLALLGSILADPEFRAARVATNFLAERASLLAFQQAPADLEDHALAAVWWASRGAQRPAGAAPAGGRALWQDTDGWRLGSAPRSSWRFADRTVVVQMTGDGAYQVTSNGSTVSLLLMERTDESLVVEVAGRRRRAAVALLGCELHLSEASGRRSVLRLQTTEDALEQPASAEGGSLLTPLPGTVVAVHVATGQHVLRGAPLVTVEAMKMEHTLSAPHEGVVGRIPFGVAERVAAGAVLVELTPGPGPGAVQDAAAGPGPG